MSVKNLVVCAATMVLASCAQVATVQDTITDEVAGKTADNIDSTTLRVQDKAFTPQFGPVEFADAFGSRETGHTAPLANFQQTLKHQRIFILTATAQWCLAAT